MNRTNKFYRVESERLAWNYAGTIPKYEEADHMQTFNSRQTMDIMRRRNMNMQKLSTLMRLTLGVAALSWGTSQSHAQTGPNPSVDYTASSTFLMGIHGFITADFSAETPWQGTDAIL